MSEKSDKAEKPMPENPAKPKSYIPSYLLIGATLGGTLTYITNKPEFLVISVPGSIGMGMLKDANVHNNDSNSNVASAGLKGIALYTLGPFCCVAAAGIFIAIMFKN